MASIVGRQQGGATWSYLVDGTLLGQQIECGNISQWLCWWNGGGEPDSTVIGANETGAPVSYLTITMPAGYLNLDPESLQVTLQWTAPAAGTYRVKGNFLGVDTNEASHPVAIVHNTTTLYSNTISSFNQK